MSSVTNSIRLISCFLLLAILQAYGTQLAHAQSTQCIQPALDIPDSMGNPTISTMNFSHAATISDVDVSISITHSFIGDVELQLTHEDSGQSIVLHSRQGGSQDDMAITFDDSGVDYSSAPFNNMSIMQPLDLCFGTSTGLSQYFSGLNSNSDWTLTAIDHLPAVDDGVLDEWCLIIDSSSQPSVPGPITNFTCDRVGVDVDLQWTNHGLYDELNLYVDNQLYTTLNPSDQSFSLLALQVGTLHEICLEPIFNARIVCGDTACCYALLAPNKPANLNCELVEDTGEAQFTWDADPNHDEIWIYREGVLIASLVNNPPTTIHTSYTTGTPEVPGAEVTYTFRGTSYTLGSSSEAACTLEFVTPPLEDPVCHGDPATQTATLNWQLAFSGYTEISIYRNGSLYDVIDGLEVSATVNFPAGELSMEVCLKATATYYGDTPMLCCQVSQYPLPTPDYESCTSPAAPISVFTPAISEIDFPTDILIGDVSVRVDITHSFVGDINPIVITSPSGTQVFLQSGLHDASTGIRATFTDSGLAPGTIELGAGAPLTPSGPGTMADFQCESSAGIWQLAIVDTGPAHDGVLNEWCLGISGSQTPCCLPPTDLLCEGDCATDELTLSWTNSEAYSGINILINGSLTASLPGTATEATVIADADGMVEVVVEADCGGAAQCTVEHYGYRNYTDVILCYEGLFNPNPGLVDSCSALLSALQANGKSAQVIRQFPIDSNECLQSAKRIWLMLGTYPLSYYISPDEGNHLATLAASGIQIYIEGADFFSFLHAPSDLDIRLGIDFSLVTDGDDSLSALEGLDSTEASLVLSDLTGVAYNQDQLFSDYTDRLATLDASLEADLDWVSPLWKNYDASLVEPDYLVSALCQHVDGNRILCSSFEFGGLGQHQVEVMARYLEVLSKDDFPFIRGDCNGDGSTNISDAIQLLNILFPPAQTQPTALCDQACDCNDDDAHNLADVISLLQSIFGAPAIALPAPIGSCGPDPSPGVLSCDFYSC